MISQALLKEWFHYEPITGVFTRLKSVSPRTKVGDTVSSVGRKRRATIAIGKGRYYTNKLAWLYSTGHYPTCIVDHIDCNEFNDALLNLRLTDAQGNACNRRKNKGTKHPFKGVSVLPSGRFRVRVKERGVMHSVCGFEHESIAHEFASLMRETLHGAFARHA